MNAPSDDIKDMLEAESSLGLVFADNLFVGKEPHEPDECATIFDTTGLPNQVTLGMEGNYYYPSIQIRVRSDDYRDGWELIQNIMISLHGRAQETWNGTLYSIIKQTSGPTLLDWDDNNRVRFVVNFDIQRR